MKLSKTSIIHTADTTAISGLSRWSAGRGFQNTNQMETNDGDQDEESRIESQATMAAKPTKAKPSAKSDGKLSCIVAAAKVLAEAKEPMTTKAMIEQVAAKKYWTSPGGKTPAATLYSQRILPLTCHVTNVRALCG